MKSELSNMKTNRTITRWLALAATDTVKAAKKSIMKTPLKLRITGLTLLALTASVSPAQNILVDPGFEDQTGWNLTNGAAYSQNYAHSGSWSMYDSAVNNVPGSFQQFAAFPGLRFELTGYAMTPTQLAGSPAYGFLQITYFDSANNNLGTVETSPGNAKTSAQVNSATTPGVWTFLDTGIATAPSNTAYMQAFTIYVDYSGNQQGVYFDDLSMAWSYLATNQDQGKRFFRLRGPVPATITAFTADGYITWTNAPTNATFTVQTATSLLGPSNWVDYVQLPITSGVNSNQVFDLHPPSGMALIPVGSFTIGGMDDYDPTPAYVGVSAFYMDRTLVTYSQWQTVYNWATNHGYGFNHEGAGKMEPANQPVQSVDWYDCVKWCNARSQQEGLTPVYYTDGALTQVYTNREIDITNSNVNWAANGYRLPTEAEFEKAARGGSMTRFPWGDRINASLANYPACHDCLRPSYDDGPDGPNAIGLIGGSPNTSPVGSFWPNGYGLFDMVGNLDEWCWDWWGGTPYPAGSPYLGGSDPRGPETAPFNGYRVMRGGSWNGGLTCARRSSFYPSLIRGWIGFRCVRKP